MKTKIEKSLKRDSFVWIIVALAVVFAICFIFVPQDKKQYNDIVRYFFSAAPQTMGAILGIAFTTLYLIISNISSKGGILFSPLKRLLFGDPFVRRSVGWGFVPIASIIFIPVSSINCGFQFLNIRLETFMLAISIAFVTFSGAYSIYNLVIFIKDRFELYTNPLKMIRSLENNNNKLSEDEKQSITMFYLLQDADKFTKDEVFDVAFFEKIEKYEQFTDKFVDDFAKDLCNFVIYNSDNPKVEFEKIFNLLAFSIYYTVEYGGNYIKPKNEIVIYHMELLRHISKNINYRFYLENIDNAGLHDVLDSLRNNLEKQIKPYNLKEKLFFIKLVICLYQYKENYDRLPSNLKIRLRCQIINFGKDTFKDVYGEELDEMIEKYFKEYEVLFDIYHKSFNFLSEKLLNNSFYEEIKKG